MNDYQHNSVAYSVCRSNIQTVSEIFLETLHSSRANPWAFKWCDPHGYSIHTLLIKAKPQRATTIFASNILSSKAKFANKSIFMNFDKISHSWFTWRWISRWVTQLRCTKAGRVAKKHLETKTSFSKLPEVELKEIDRECSCRSRLNEPFATQEHSRPPHTNWLKKSSSS